EVHGVSSLPLSEAQDARRRRGEPRGEGAEEVVGLFAVDVFVTGEAFVPDGARRLAVVHASSSNPGSVPGRTRRKRYPIPRGGAALAWPGQNDYWRARFHRPGSRHAQQRTSPKDSVLV